MAPDEQTTHTWELDLLPKGDRMKLPWHAQDLFRLSFAEGLK